MCPNGTLGGYSAFQQHRHPSQRLWNDLLPPKNPLGGGPCPCPKRWGGDKPIVRYDLFLTKALKLGMGEVKNCPQTRTQNPTARMYLTYQTRWWRSDSRPKSVLQRNRKPTDNSFPWQQKISQNSSRYVWVLAIHKEIMKVFSFLIYLICPQLALSISAISWLESPEFEGHCVREGPHFRDENSSGFKSSCVQNRERILTWRFMQGKCKFKYQIMTQYMIELYRIMCTYVKCIKL